MHEESRHSRCHNGMSTTSHLINGTSHLINGKVGPPLQTTIVNEFVYSESASNVTLITGALTLENQSSCDQQDAG